MKKILFLIMGHQLPSSRKRVLGSLEYIRARGNVADVREVPKNIFGQIALLGRVPGYDLVVIQKKLFRKALLRLMRLLNGNLLYDLDDAVMFLEVERNEPLSGKYFKRFLYTAGACRGVIAGNPYLAEFARAAGAEAVVLPTPVDTDTIKPACRKTGGNGLIIGWIGTKGNLPHLKLVEKPLARVLEKYPEAVLKVVSNARPDMPGIRLEYKPWAEEDELTDLQSFDIGIMPLSDDIWTRGKGGYKLLQYMAAGVPSVASPVGINSRIIKSGINGYLAGDEGTWTEVLDRLAASPELRQKVGMAGREAVEREYSLARYNERLVQFLEGAP